MDHPVEKPVSALPVSRMPKKVLGSFARWARAIVSQPTRQGTPLSISANLRPKRSDIGQAIKPPNVAPIGPRAYVII